MKKYNVLVLVLVLKIKYKKYITLYSFIYFLLFLFFFCFSYKKVLTFEQISYILSVESERTEKTHQVQKEDAEYPTLLHLPSVH